MPRKRQNDRSADEDDPILQMWGVGKELWAPEGGDAFIARERAEREEGAVEDQVVQKTEPGVL